uniref:Uncharacterized protein n=1 Tax=Rhizophagus irregularis (strain DAOM 181602 / DAOM 197198 / MUCL 43194) TaxID=747089 RepID=U9TQV1_RHIID
MLMRLRHICNHTQLCKRQINGTDSNINDERLTALKLNPGIIPLIFGDNNYYSTGIFLITKNNLMDRHLKDQKVDEIIVHLESAKKILKSVKERYQFALELKLEILEPDWKMIVNYQRSLLTEDNDYNIYFNGLYKTLENNQVFIYVLRVQFEIGTFNEIFDMKISIKRSIMQIRISEEFSLTECKQQEVSVELCKADVTFLAFASLIHIQ